MRLTLRTLLAWLDDKLPPAEVREIGKQVADASYAKDLVERIHKVTRQRRLSAPSSTGPDATDPNLVASYIDNELDPDHVAEFEKKCLTSDVHLAEVSSVHQILSLIGQKAQVPHEARYRMYQLVKGREATRPKRRTATAPAPEPEPVSQPIQPWVTPAPPPRPFYQEYGPAVLVLGLMVVLGWSAWKTLSLPEPTRAYRPPADLTDPVASAAGPEAASPTTSPAPAPTVPNSAAPETTAVKPPAPATSPAPEATDAAKTPAPASDVPAGAVGLAKKPAGMLLRYNSEHRDWDRVTEAVGLNDQDRMLSLDPFRSTLEIGSGEVELVRETEVWVKSTPKTLAARFALTQGRVVLHGTPSGLPFEIQSGKVTVTITPPPNTLVGVERVATRAPGEPTAPPAALRVYAVEGPVAVAVDDHTQSIEASGTLTVAADGKFSDSAAGPAPTWVTETSPSPFDQKVGEQFLQFFRADRPAVTSLVEASEEEQKDVCRLAIAGLRAVGDVSLVVPLLNKKGDSTATVARRAAIAVLRASLEQGPDAARVLREQLDRELGEDLAATSEKLLVGYTAKEAEDEATFATLVSLLGSTDDAELGVRELALDNLRQLTGRDDLGYDPARPEGKGLKAWQDLLKDHELKPVKGAAPEGK